MFLLIFRYVFGGAIQTGDVEYVDFLIPALAAVSGLFASGAVGVAEDAESGLFDRLRSLPVPRWALLFGRSMADTALIMWGTVVTLVVGVRSSDSGCSGGLLGGLAALGLCVLFAAAFSWLQIYLGSDLGQRPGRAGHLVRGVPVDLRVERLRARSRRCPAGCSRSPRHQPVTAMVGAVRTLTLGGDTEALLGHSATWFVVRSIAWSVIILAVFITLSARRFARL